MRYIIFRSGNSQAENVSGPTRTGRHSTWVQQVIPKDLLTADKCGAKKNRTFGESRVNLEVQLVVNRLAPTPGDISELCFSLVKGGHASCSVNMNCARALFRPSRCQEKAESPGLFSGVDENQVLKTGEEPERPRSQDRKIDN